MISRILIAVAALVLVLCAFSCNDARFYSVGVMNRSMGDIQDVVIQWDKDTMRFGSLLEGRNATKTPFFAKPPATITISWRVGDQNCAMDVDMTNLVPDGFDGTVFLVVKGPDKVGVGLVNEGDKQAYERLSQAN